MTRPRLIPNIGPLVKNPAGEGGGGGGGGGTGTITAIQESGQHSNSTPNALAFGSNVAVGNLIVVIAARFNTSSNPFSASDCTKSAGTATLGTIALDKAIEFNPSAGKFISAGVFSAPVTGAGSCTMQIAGGAGSANNIAIAEYHPSTGNIVLAGGQTNSSSGNSTAADSGTVVLANNGIIIGGLVDDDALDDTTPAGITPDAAFTAIFQEQNGNSFLCSSAIRRIVSGGVTDSASWTLIRAMNWAAAAAAYQTDA